jgi:glycosyltransferase involved in cell wall biosynthesis
MQFSVIICTHNRATSLARTLQSLAQQTLASEDFEVIVVDNGSTDNTQDVVREWSDQLRHLSYIFEPRLGLNTARNRGWQEARGEWIAYLDDDARAGDTWLQAWAAVLNQPESGVAFGGGKVMADWRGQRPVWLPVTYESVYTTLDHGGEARWLTPQETILGTHMIFARKLLAAYSGFDERVGRVGEGLQTYAGDETELINRLRRAGHAPYYLPSAIVWHEVASERLARTWLLRRLYMDGRTQPVLDSRGGTQPPYTWRRVMFDARAALANGLRALISGCLGRQHDMLYWLGAAMQRLGRLAEEVSGLCQPERRASAQAQQQI